ncbi:MAG TPA: hypothetical protein VE619_09110 [Nitrososphaeraceae archaeon]|nr:hypothetical protein [Nitrososphaeraceae archaeon]
MPSPTPPSGHGNKDDVKDEQRKEEVRDLEITRQDGNDGSGSNSDNESTDANNINNVTIFELLDDLISHMNTTKNIFTLLILSSFILAPIALVVAGIFVLHPFFLYRILFRLPAVGGILLLFISVSIMLASVWLFIGASEQRFFSHWNKKFNRYVSKRKQVDRELGQ